MEIDTEALLGLFEKVRHIGAVNTDGMRIRSSSLGFNDFPWIKEYIPAIAQVMYAKLVNSGIAYDGLVSMPSGGDEYTAAVQQLAEKHENRKIPRLTLDRCGRKYPQRIKDRANLACGSRLILIDDSVWTGKTLREATSLLRTECYEVAGYLCGSDLVNNGLRGLNKPIMAVFDSALLKQKVLRTA